MAAGPVAVLDQVEGEQLRADAERFPLDQVEGEQLGDGDPLDQLRAGLVEGLGRRA